MDTLSIIFVLIASLNVIMGAIEWVKTGENQFSKIAGWSCAILWCIQASLK